MVSKVENNELQKKLTMEKKMEIHSFLIRENLLYQLYWRYLKTSPIHHITSKKQ